MISLRTTTEFDNGILQCSAFMSVTLGIVVLFAGKRVNDVVGFLKEFSIPEPVTGGLIAFLLVALLFLIAVCVTLFVVFPLMGRSYDAAAVCAGFGGISLGSTPTAVANMSAVWFRLRAAILDQDGAGGEDLKEIRFIVNYDFPII